MGIKLDIKNIKQYRKAIQEIARPYLFNISIPYIEENLKRYEPAFTTIYATSTSLPSYDIEPVEIKVQEYLLKIGSSSKFKNTQTITFILDHNHTIRNRILIWMSAIYDIKEYVIQPSSSYKEDEFIINHMTPDLRNIIAEYKLVGAFPIKCGEVNLTQANETEVMTFDVEFAYDYYDVNMPEESSFGKTTGEGTDETVVLENIDETQRDRVGSLFTGGGFLPNIPGFPVNIPGLESFGSPRNRSRFTGSNPNNPFNFPEFGIQDIQRIGNQDEFSGGNES